MWKIIFGIIAEYHKQHPEMLLYNIIFIAVNVVNGFYLPKYYGEMIDTFKSNPTRFLNIFANILLIKGLVYALGEIEEYYTDIQKLGIKNLIQNFIITKISDKYMEDPEEVLVGEKITTILKIQGVVANWYAMTKQYLIPYAITLVATAVFAYSLDPKFPFLLLFLLFGAVVMIVSNIYLCSSAGRISNQKYVKVYQEVEDHLSNLLTIQTYNQAEIEQKQLNNYQLDYQTSLSKTEKCTLTWRLVGNVFILIAMYLFMYKAYHLLSYKKISHTAFMSLFFIITELLSSLGWMVNIFHSISLDYSTMNDLEEISDLNLFGDTKSPSITYPPSKPINTPHLITVQNITFQYKKSNKPIVKDFTMVVNRGDRIALVGDIGCGKSTILKIILGLLKPTKGTLYLGRHSYKNWELTEIFKQFGYMTQNPVLFNRSILDNILFSNQTHTRKEVIELLEYFNLNDVFSRLDNGIDSLVGKNGGNLSGGQRQIIWFLRIYLNNPQILLLDEPTASLSKESKEKLWNLIQKGFGKKTIIMASHDDFLIKMATRKVKV
jgi:ABC-type multidrug transport system fused ATPase/permease subunit